jgi:hypothetical protein
LAQPRAATVILTSTKFAEETLFRAVKLSR